jgi:hypothetical protein
MKGDRAVTMMKKGVELCRGRRRRGTGSDREEEVQRARCPERKSAMFRGQIDRRVHGRGANTEWQSGRR